MLKVRAFDFETFRPLPSAVRWERLFCEVQDRKMAAWWRSLNTAGIFELPYGPCLAVAGQHGVLPDLEGWPLASLAQSGSVHLNGKPLDRLSHGPWGNIVWCSSSISEVALQKAHALLQEKWQ